MHPPIQISRGCILGLPLSSLWAPLLKFVTPLLGRVQARIKTSALPSKTLEFITNFIRLMPGRLSTPVSVTETHFIFVLNSRWRWRRWLVVHSRQSSKTINLEIFPRGNMPRIVSVRTTIRIGSI